MDDAASEDLMGSVLRLTYRGIVDDAAGFADSRQGPDAWAAPRRFSTRLGMEATRHRIITLCGAHGADDGLQEFLSTRWLERFAPLAM